MRAAAGPPRATQADALGAQQRDADLVAVDAVVEVPPVIRFVLEDQRQPDHHVKAAVGVQIGARGIGIERVGELAGEGVDQALLHGRIVRHVLVTEQPGHVVECVALARVLPIEPEHGAVGHHVGVARTGVPFDEAWRGHAQLTAHRRAVERRRGNPEVIANDARPVDQRVDPRIVGAQGRHIALQALGAGRALGQMQTGQGRRQQPLGLCLVGRFQGQREALTAERFLQQNPVVVRRQQGRGRRPVGVERTQRAHLDGRKMRRVAPRGDHGFTVVEHHAQRFAVASAGIVDAGNAALKQALAGGGERALAPRDLVIAAALALPGCVGLLFGGHVRGATLRETSG